MFVFAFQVWGKRLLLKNSCVVDLEMSDIKYDNSSVQHLVRKETKINETSFKG